LFERAYASLHLLILLRIAYQHADTPHSLRLLRLRQVARLLATQHGATSGHAAARRKQAAPMLRVEERLENAMKEFNLCIASERLVQAGRGRGLGFRAT
jgi:hypothetical protein